MTRPPTFRWNVVAFVVIVVIVVLAGSGMLVLLDPRSQAWWGARFSDLGAFIRGILDALLPG